MLQFEIYLANLDPTIGVEMKNTRPVLIISPDEMNKYIQTVIIAPITSKSRSYPTIIKIRLNDSASFVVLDQIKTLDKQRLYKLIGTVNDEEIDNIKLTLQEMFK
jgi:mRNA interferase MazF